MMMLLPCICGAIKWHLCAKRDIKWCSAEARCVTGEKPKHLQMEPAVSLDRCLDTAWRSGEIAFLRIASTQCSCWGTHVSVIQAVRGIPSLKAAAKSFPRRVEAALGRMMHAAITPTQHVYPLFTVSSSRCICCNAASRPPLPAGVGGKRG
jgi:hypothetical protein